MTNALSREDIAREISEIVNATDPFTIAPHATAILSAYDVLRQRLAEVEQDKESLKQTVLMNTKGFDQIKQAIHADPDISILEGIANLKTQLSAAQAERDEAVRVAKAMTEPAPITDADIHWANESLSQLDRLTRQLAEKDAEMAFLKRELSQRSGWQKCVTHGEINADYAWGCPDCVHEMRHQIITKDAEMASLQDRLNQMTRLKVEALAAWNVSCDETVVAQAEIARLKHEVSQLLFFTPGGGQ